MLVLLTVGNQRVYKDKATSGRMKLIPSLIKISHIVLKYLGDTYTRVMILHKPVFFMN
jgi:hypothetical protein